jgi:hypothetical protein
MHFDIIDTLYSLPGIVIGLTLHEYGDDQSRIVYF